MTSMSVTGRSIGGAGIAGARIARTTTIAILEKAIAPTLTSFFSVV